MLIPSLVLLGAGEAAIPLPDPEPLDLLAAAQLDCDFTAELAPVALGSFALGSFAQDVGSIDDIEVIDLPERFGAQDSWRWTIQLAYGDDFSDTTFVLGGLGLSWFVAEDLSLNFELNAAGYDQPNDDAISVALSMLVRWHAISGDGWSLFGDLGIGFVVCSDDVPEDGSDFNFNPHMGVGASFDVADDVRMLLGARWYHLSNGRVFRDNPGLDTLELWAGLSFGF